MTNLVDLDTVGEIMVRVRNCYGENLKSSPREACFVLEISTEPIKVQVKLDSGEDDVEAG